MRWALAAVVVLIAGVAAAQPLRRYDLYIYDPGDEREIYAFASRGHAVAIEVRGCGDVTLIPDPRSLVSEFRARRARDDNNVVNIFGDTSRVELGPCGADGEEPDELEDGAIEIDEDFEGADHEPAESLVIFRNMSASQMRITVRSLDAAPEPVRQQMLDALDL